MTNSDRPQPWLAGTEAQCGNRDGYEGQPDKAVGIAIVAILLWVAVSTAVLAYVNLRT